MTLNILSLITLQIEWDSFSSVSSVNGSKHMTENQLNHFSSIEEGNALIDIEKECHVMLERMY